MQMNFRYYITPLCLIGGKFNIPNRHSKVASCAEGEPHPRELIKSKQWTGR